MRWFKNIYIQSRVIGAEHSKSWKIISSAHSRAWLTIKIFFTPLPTKSSWASCHQGGGSRMASFPKQACRKEDNRWDCWIKINPFCATSSGFLTKSGQELTLQEPAGECLFIQETRVERIYWMPPMPFHILVIPFPWIVQTNTCVPLPLPLFIKTETGVRRSQDGAHDPRGNLWQSYSCIFRFCSQS